MANLIGIVGSTSEARRKFLASVEPDLMTFPWLERGCTQFGDGDVAWAAAPSAPLAVSSSDQGRTTVVLGSVYRDRTPALDDAAFLEQKMGVGDRTAVSGQNGFYLAATTDPSGEVRIGADLLGLFPVYYSSTTDVLLFSTSAHLCRRFSGLETGLSIPGLVGILLTMHLVGGQSIWKGVRRLSPGHVLVWRRGETAREERVTTLQPSFEHFGESLAEHVETVRAALHRIVRRETADRRVSVLLSGGLDSRIVAGYMRRDFGTAVPACTFGDPGDHEMTCASRVARSLGWSHERIPVDFSRFPEFAWKQVEVEQLSAGCFDLSFFQAGEGLRGVAPFTMTGLWGDATMGGSRHRWAYDEGRRDYTFGTWFARTNRYGLPPSLVSKLIAPDVLGSALDDVLSSLEDGFRSCPGLPFQRAVLFDLAHRLRYHVGALASRLSFSSWPLLPYVDLDFLRTSIGMPVATILGRRLQIEVVRKEFPDLARLPLDRNSEDTSPLIPSLRWRLPLTATSLWRNLGARGGPERRFYYRVFDFSNAGWTAVRQEAEGFRAKAEIVLDRETLGALLPDPSVRVGFEDGIIDSSGRKMVLAFLLWAGRYL